MKLKKHVYRATGISLLILLFGALGAGFLFVVGNIFGVQILKPGSAISEMLWHLFFGRPISFLSLRVDPILLDRGAARRCASIDAEHPVLPLCGAI